MKRKSDGRNILRFWMGFSELLFYTMWFQILKNLEWLGIGICILLLTVKWYEIYTDKKDVFHQFKSRKKVKNLIVAGLTLLVVLMDLANPFKYQFMFVLCTLYYFVNTYALNLYEWIMRWGNLEELSSSKDYALYAQLDETPTMLELANRKFVGRRLLPGFIGFGIVAYVLWISPVFGWVRNVLIWLLSRVALVLATLILGLFPKISDSGGQQNNAPTLMEQINKMAKERAVYHNYSREYNYIGIVVIVVIILLVGWFVWQRLKKRNKSYSAFQTSSKQGERMGVGVQVKALFSTKKQTKRTESPEALLRKKYIQLLKRLEKRGLAIEKTDTADLLKSKLLELYPNQDELINVITEAYCEQRYAERDPENIEEVLSAFHMLKEASNETSRRSSV